MVEFFRAGGAGMFPTLLFGFGMVWSGVLYVLRGEQRQLMLMASLGMTTLGAGMLGFCMGVVSSCRYLPNVPAGEQLSMLALGVSESLHNLVLALVLFVITGVLASVGAYRVRAAVGLAARVG